MNETLKGPCLCGGVRIEVEGDYYDLDDGIPPSEAF
jgi:hypothetical protein